MEMCVKISGRVQGIGFRYWVLRQAEKIGGLSGFACNLPSGEVAVYMQGNAANLQKLQITLHKGSLFSRVDSVIDAPELKQLLPPITEGKLQRI